LDEENFAPQLKKLNESGEAFTPIHAASGFLNTGFFPLNQNIVNKEKLNITETFNFTLKSSTSNFAPITPTQELSPET